MKCVWGNRSLNCGKNIFLQVWSKFRKGSRLMKKEEGSCRDQNQRFWIGKQTVQENKKSKRGIRLDRRSFERQKRRSEERNWGTEGRTSVKGKSQKKRKTLAFCTGKLCRKLLSSLFRLETHPLCSPYNVAWALSSGYDEGSIQFSTRMNVHFRVKRTEKNGLWKRISLNQAAHKIILRPTKQLYF